MNWSPKSRTAPLLASVSLVAAVLFTPIHAAEKPADKKKETAAEKTARKQKEKADKAEAARKSAQGDGLMDLPLPEGHPSKGLVIPVRDPEGKMQFQFTAGVARKVDAENVRFAEMHLDTFDNNEQPEMQIELPDSILNLRTRIIRTTEPFTIRRADFELKGHTMEFDTQSRKGKLKNGLKMTIYNVNLDATAKPATPEPKK